MRGCLYIIMIKKSHWWMTAQKIQQSAQAYAVVDRAHLSKSENTEYFIHPILGNYSVNLQHGETSWLAIKPRNLHLHYTSPCILRSVWLLCWWGRACVRLLVMVHWHHQINTNCLSAVAHTSKGVTAAWILWSIDCGVACRCRMLPMSVIICSSTTWSSVQLQHGHLFIEG